MEVIQDFFLGSKALTTLLGIQNLGLCSSMSLCVCVSQGGFDWTFRHPFNLLMDGREFDATYILLGLSSQLETRKMASGFTKPAWFIQGKETRQVNFNLG